MAYAKILQSRRRDLFLVICKEVMVMAKFLHKVTPQQSPVGRNTAEFGGAAHLTVP